MVDIMADNITDIITGIMTEPTRYTLIIAFITSVIIFVLNELAKKRYLIQSLRLERFESLLQELYAYAGIYEDIKMVSKINISGATSKTKYEIIAFTRLFKDLFSKSVLT